MADFRDRQIGNRQRSSLCSGIVERLLSYRKPAYMSAAGILALGMLHLGFARIETPMMLAASVIIDTVDTPESSEVDTTLLAAVDNPEPEDSSEIMPEETEIAISRELGEGRASYYGAELAGRRTASGERFDPNGMTAAHPSLPFGTRLRVTSIRNGNSVIVRINDRGPFGGKRVIDLSYAAAKALGMIRRGTDHVKMEVLK